MAAAAVIDFFERLSDGWLFDASLLRKLWAAIRKDKDAASTQLAKCLLVYICAPEKLEGDKVIPRCMKEWAAHMPIDPVWKAWGEDIIGSLLGQLAEWIPQAAKHSRVRVLDVIVSILRGLHQDASLEDGIRTAVVGSLLEHLPDKDDKVRQLVVIALTKLGFVEDADDGSDQTAASELLAELTDALHSDISQDVRTELVNRLPLDNATLVEVLRHQLDRSAKVAASVYDKMTRDVPLMRLTRPGGVSASLEQRTSLLWYGLNEPRAEVRSAAQSLLAKWFTEDSAKDIVVLLEAFDPQANAELCLLIVEQLVADEHWDPMAWLKAETAASRSLSDLLQIAEEFEQQEQAGVGAAVSGGSGRGSWLGNVSPALAFAWLYACRKVDDVSMVKGRAAAAKVGATVAQAEASAGAQAEAVLEAFLPTAQQMARLCFLGAKAGPAYRYIAAQLLELATLSYMNWVDASSRPAADAALWDLITQISRPDGKVLPSEGTLRHSFLPAASGGSGLWEATVLRFAAAVLGSDRVGLVQCVLPMILQLAEEGSPSDRLGGRTEEALEGPLLQALTFLHLLMAMAGPGVQPSAGASAPPKHGAATDNTGSCRSSWTLAQAVDSLAWIASKHTSSVVRAAAIRCYIELCLRDGGREYLPRAVAMLAPMLPAAAGGSAFCGIANDDDLAFAAQQQLPQRLALQGLMDLALTWGEPTVTAALKKAAAMATDGRHIDDITAQMAALGVDQQRSGTGADAAAAAATGPEVAGVVPVLLRLTHGVIRKLQGSDDYVAARGVVADALLGSARLVHAWSLQLQLNKRLRHQPITTMQPRAPEQLLTRLLLARYSPALEAEPWLRSQISTFFKAFQEAASAASEEGEVHRRMLAGSFLHAARWAMALPAPSGAPATARGCAAPALIEFAGELLASAAAKAVASKVEALGETGDDGVADDAHAPAGQTAHTSAAARDGPAPDAIVWLCELILEEVVRLGSPGSASLDIREGRVRAYATELCKTPMRLLHGLPAVSTSTSSALISVRRLAYLGRRAALTAGESLVKTVVPDTAYKKLQEFVRALEELQLVKTAPLSEDSAKAFLSVLREQLKGQLEELPSLEDVTADLEPDDDWDVLTVDASQEAAGDQAHTKKRAATSKGAKGGTSKARGGTTTRTRQTNRTTASRATASSRRGDTRNMADVDDNSDSDLGYNQGSNSDADDSCGRTSSAATSKAAKSKGRAARASVRPAASQDSLATSDVGSQPGRRSARAAAAKASERLEALKLNGQHRDVIHRISSQQRS